MRWFRRAYIAGMLSALFLIVGCSRPATVPVASGNVSGPQRLPFQRMARLRGISPTASLLPTEIPAGTLLDIRMNSIISSASSQAGDTFDAVLDVPITLRGQILAPRGTAVTGKVMTAKSSSGAGDPGYLRLTLTTISIHGKKLMLQTSSLFAKASSYENQAVSMIGAAAQSPAPAPNGKKDIEFSVGHRFTFRMTETLPLQAEVATLPSE